MFNATETLFQRLALALAGIGAVLIVLMMLQIFADVISRFVFSYPLPGTIEIVSHYYMVGSTFLPIALVHLERGHFFAESFKSLVSPRVIRALDGTNGLVLAFMAGLIAWRTLGTALESTAVNEQVQLSLFVIPTWPARWTLPVSFCLLTLVALLEAWRDFSGRSAAADAPVVELAS